METSDTVSRSGRLRRSLPPLAGVIGLLVLIAWLAGAFDDKIEPGRRVPSVRGLDGRPTARVEAKKIQSIEEAVGTFKASSRTLVSARVLAAIEEIAVAAGEQVEEGDVLVRLDGRELQARLDQAHQSLASAVATQREAKQMFDRARPLFESKVLSESEMDRAETQLGVAVANRRQAEDAVREAEVMLSHATVTAPKAGRIVDRLAEPGDVARPGVPLLVLYDASSLRLEAPVSERLAIQMRPGEKLQVRVDAIAADIDATVDEIVPQADAPSRSFLVKVSVPLSENLYEGMFGRLRIPAGTRRRLCVPARAVGRLGQLEFVDVAGADDAVERRFVKTGKAVGEGCVEVLSGLEAAERVVLHGPDAAAGDE
jgi:RND family efflux transporter MFP subunit